jgi:hypothetical protein
MTRRKPLPIQVTPGVVREPLGDRFVGGERIEGQSAFAETA